MFEIKCIVGDKKLVEVLTLLDGHTLEPPVVLPVRGTVANGHAVPNGKVHGMSRNPPEGGGSTEILRKYIAGRKSVATKELRTHLETKGYSANGYSYALQQLLKNGDLKKTKEYSVYEVAKHHG